MQLTDFALKQLSPDDDMEPLLDLMRRSYAYMQGRVDPPSSLARLDAAKLADAAGRSEIWALDPGPVACVVLTQRPSTLYLSKLAVDEPYRRQGLARRLVDNAMTRARALKQSNVTLQVRIELTETQAIFQKLGFHEVNRTAHLGYDHDTAITFKRPV